MVFRATWSLRKQEALLGESFQTSQKQFAEATQGKSYGAYSIAENVGKKREAILKQLHDIESGWVTSLDPTNKAYATAAASLQTLQDEINTWPKLAPELQGLADALDALSNSIDGNSMLPPTKEPGEPQFVIAARKLLIGGPIEASGIDALRKQVATATSLAQAWKEANDHAKSVTSEFKGLVHNTGLTPGQKTTLDSVNDKLIAVWKHLSEVQTIDNVSSIQAIGADLDSADISVTAISSALQPTRIFRILNLGQRFMLTSLGQKPVEILKSWVDLGHTEANDTRRADLLTRAIRFGDMGTGLLAFVIAVLTGMNSYYLSKPFGTLQDYMTLFVWAAGTKATLDILTSVLDRFSSPN
jgi:hypothetical protein